MIGKIKSIVKLNSISGFDFLTQVLGVFVVLGCFSVCVMKFSLLFIQLLLKHHFKFSRTDDMSLCFVENSTNK